MTRSYCWDSSDYMTNINEGDWEKWKQSDEAYANRCGFAFSIWLWKKDKKKNILLGYYHRLARLIARLMYKLKLTLKYEMDLWASIYRVLES